MKKLIGILSIVGIFAFAGIAHPSGFIGAAGGGNATTLHGFALEIPDAADDGKYIQYEHTGTLWQLATPAGGGDMTIAVWDGDADGFIDADAGGTDINTSASTGIPQVAAGVWSVDWTIGGVVFGDSTPDTVGEFGHASGDFSFYGDNSEDFTIQVGSAANTLTLSSATGITDLATLFDFVHGADPADAGDIRLSNAETIMWEASAAGVDVEGISVDASEVVQIGASGASGVTITPATTITGTLTVGGSYIAVGTDPAEAGIIRLPNATTLTWEASPAGTDVGGLGVDANENILIGVSGMASVGVYPGTTAGKTVNIYAYDIDGAAYDTMISAASHATDPTLTLAADGGIALGGGDIDLKPNDSDDYIKLTTVTNVPWIKTVGDANLGIDILNSAATSTLTIDNSTAGQAVDVVLGSVTTTGTLSLYDDGSNAYVKVQPSGSTAASYTITLPTAPPGATAYLTMSDAGVLATAAGTGGVNGPGASTDNAIVRWNGAGGTDLLNSPIVLDDDGDMHFPDDDVLSFGTSDDGQIAYTGGVLKIYGAVAGTSLQVSMPAAASGTSQTYVTIDGTLPAHGAGAPTDTFLAIAPTIGINTVATTTDIMTIAFTSPAWATAVASAIRGVYISPTIGNATAGTNTVTLWELADVAGDAQVTLNAIKLGNLTGTAAVETAIDIGTGWDYDIDLADDTANIVHSGATSLSIVSTSGTVIVESVTFTGGAMTGVTALTVDNLGIDGNTITASAGAINIDPFAGSAIVLDGTISVDAGVVTGATSITSTAFVGALTGNADTVTVADAGGDATTWPLLGTAATGSLAPATDAGLTYNATTNALSATTFIGALTGSATGNDTLASADFANQGTTTTVLHGNAAGNPAWGAIVEADITLADNTTNDVSNTKHGFVPKATDVLTNFLRADGAWAVPGGAGDVTGVGDCLTGDCLDGTSDGGTYIRLYDGDSHYTQIASANVAGNVTMTFPATAGNVAIDAATLAISGVWEVQDDVNFVFGNDANILMQYDEAVDDQFIIATTTTGATAITDPLFEFLVPATPTANQQVFGIAKGTQASNTPLMTLDEDGDVDFAGAITSSATGDSYLKLSNNDATAGSSDYRFYFEGGVAKVYELSTERILVAEDRQSGGIILGTEIPITAGGFGYDAATTPGAFGFFGANSEDWYIQVGSAANVVTMGSTTAATLVITPATKVTGVFTTGAGIELGNASDTTLSRAAAGLLAVEGNTIPEVSHASGGIIFTGPTQVRSIAIPDANSTILTTNAAVTVAQGGTGRATGTTAYALVATGTTATAPQQTLGQGAAGTILVGAGAGLPTWGTDLPTAVTIGGGYVYRAGGTDVADGDVVDDLTITSTKLVTGASFALGDTNYIGITGNEIITFNAAGTIVASGATFSAAGGTQTLTPVTDTAANFAANFTGANLYGGTFICNGAGTIQLPLMVAGMNFTVITLGAIAVVIDTNINDGYLMDGTTGVEGSQLTNLSTAGDIAVLQYYTADDWLITTNGWTPG